MRIRIFDYGAGNIFNIRTALRRINVRTQVVRKIKRYDSSPIVLPGVGGFGLASKAIEKSQDGFERAIANGTPILGICLGMQLFFRRSEEGPGTGLGILPGIVARLRGDVKVPHLGWNQLESVRENGILDGLPEKSWCYFVHSYFAKTAPPFVLAQVTYGATTFPAVVAKDSLVGTQFHPEKSAQNGRRILENFVAFCRK